MSELVRIGTRLFNLNHVTTIEPEAEGGNPVVDIHIVQGRTVRLRGDDARAALNLVESYAPFPVELPEADPTPDAGESGVREVADEQLREIREGQQGWTTFNP